MTTNSDIDFEDVMKVLSKKIDENLIKDLFRDYRKAKREYMLGEDENSLGPVSKFCETVYQLLNKIVFDEIPKNINFIVIEKNLENYPKELPSSIRIIIPRIARCLYGVRSKRGIVHKGEVNPNFIDATLAISVMDWIIAEFVRLYYTSDYNRISSLINKIVAKEIVEVSIREFLNKVRPKNNVEIDLALSYFLRRFKRKIKFTSQDIDILRANAFIPKSSNTTEDLNKNVKRGHLRREKINGKNMYSITQSGIEHIEKMEEVIK